MRDRRCAVDHLAGADRRGAAEDHEVDQRVGAETVGAVHRGAAGLADSHQAGDDPLRIGTVGVQHFAPIIRGNAAHIVVNGRQNRDWLAGDVDAGEDLGALGNPRQAFMQHGRIEMVEMQEDVILVLADAAAFADLQRHAARYHVARGKVLGRRRVTLHEALAFGIDEITAFAARASVIRQPEP